MPKLSDTQAILLSSAAQRADGHLLPVPQTLTAGSDAVAKAITALLKNGLAEEAPTSAAAQAWRADGDQRFGATITDAGRAVIGVEPDGTVMPSSSTDATPPPTPEEPRSTKAALLLSLLRREQGATLAELVEATGWLPHTARAALTGIRKKGHAVAKGKRGDLTCYTLAA